MKVSTITYAMENMIAPDVNACKSSLKTVYSDLNGMNLPSGFSGSSALNSAMNCIDNAHSALTEYLECTNMAVRSIINDEAIIRDSIDSIDSFYIE